MLLTYILKWAMGIFQNSPDESGREPSSLPISCSLLWFNQVFTLSSVKIFQARRSEEIKYRAHSAGAFTSAP